MSTGPGPTRKTDGSSDSSVDDIADLLVEDDAHREKFESEQPLDDGLDVMLETPGPVMVNTFLPPPPAPSGSIEEEAESSDAEESGEPTNLAYEDLLAKLVLPAKAPEPEPAMPSLASPLPLPELDEAPTPIPALSPFNRVTSPNSQISSLSDERTLVTDNPLVAEEQEAAVREGRSSSREQPPIVREEMRPLATEPMANGAAKSRLVYLMLGGLLVLGGMILAVLVLKLLMPSPAPQPPVIISPLPSPQPAIPPAKVEPLPPSGTTAAAAAVPATEPKAAAPENEPSEEALPAESDKAQTRPHRISHPKVTSPKPTPKAAAAPKPAPVPPPAPKVTTPPKASSVPAAKPTKAASTKKASKSSGWADPFDN